MTGRRRASAVFDERPGSGGSPPTLRTDPIEAADAEKARGRGARISRYGKPRAGLLYFPACAACPPKWRAVGTPGPVSDRLPGSALHDDDRRIRLLDGRFAKSRAPPREVQDGFQNTLAPRQRGGRTFPAARQAHRGDEQRPMEFLHYAIDLFLHLDKHLM